MSPTRNVGSSHMSSSRGFSPPRNPGSYMGSSMGSPPSRNVDDFNGRSRMLDDVRTSPYGFRSVLNSQAPTSGPTFARPMLPPPVPNPHLLPPLSQLPPFGSIMQNSPFPVRSFSSSHSICAQIVKTCMPCSSYTCVMYIFLVVYNRWKSL